MITGLIIVMIIGFVALIGAFVFYYHSYTIMGQNSTDFFLAGCIFLCLAFALIYLLPSNIICKEENTIHYRPLEITKYEEFNASTIIYKKYSENNIDFVNGQLLVKKNEPIDVNKFLFSDNDKARLITQTPSSNIVVSIRYGKNLFGDVILKSPKIICYTNSEMESVKVIEESILE